MSTNTPNSEGNGPNQRQNQEHGLQGHGEEPPDAASVSPGGEAESAAPLAAAAMPADAESARASAVGTQPSRSSGDVQSLMERSSTSEEVRARLMRDSGILSCLPDAVSGRFYCNVFALI